MFSRKHADRTEAQTSPSSAIADAALDEIFESARDGYTPPPGVVAALYHYRTAPIAREDAEISCERQRIDEEDRALLAALFGPKAASVSLAEHVRSAVDAAERRRGR
jgi:hypothetical protein